MHNVFLWLTAIIVDKQEDAMRNKIIMIGIISATLSIFGCSTSKRAMTADDQASNDTVAASQPETAISEIQLPKGANNLVFTYKVRENLDVQVTFENETAYDAMQLGLTLLNKSQNNNYVPAVEEDAFFPEFFAMVNIDTSDGLLYISEKEAVNFAVIMFTQYQKKVLTPEQLKNMSERQVVDKYIVPGS
jgi:hypothetical protein